MIPHHTRLTLDDLERLAFTYGGTIEPTSTGYRLVDCVIHGKRVTFTAADPTATLAERARVVMGGVS